MKLLMIMSLMNLMFCSVSFANRESGGRHGASAVYVDFRSFGTGIDNQTANTFNVLYNAAKMRGEIVDETVVRVGREGETRHCIQLSNATQRYYFIQSLAGSILNDMQLTGSQRTAVFVGMDCHSFESATEQDITKM
jgi:hypothetical protein